MTFLPPSRSDSSGKRKRRRRRSDSAPAPVRISHHREIPSRHSPGHGNAAFAQLFADCEFVFVEGEAAANAPSLEVWRAVLDNGPAAERILGVRAILRDHAIKAGFRMMSQADVKPVTVRNLQSLEKSCVKSGCHDHL